MYTDDFSRKTRQGFNILAKYVDDKQGIVIVVVKRANDYVVGWNYDEEDGQWGQGFYDFDSQQEAEQFLLDRYKSRYRLKKTRDSKVKKIYTVKLK